MFTIKDDFEPLPTELEMRARVGIAEAWAHGVGQFEAAIDRHFATLIGHGHTITLPHASTIMARAGFHPVAGLQPVSWVNPLRSVGVGLGVPVSDERYRSSQCMLMLKIRRRHRALRQAQIRNMRARRARPRQMGG